MIESKVGTGLSGKLAVVTGASTGIGKEIARGLALQGAEVILACRNALKAEAAKKDILASAPEAELTILKLDLASQSSIRDFVKAFYGDHAALDILVNNAGMWSPDREIGPDGIERVWATNVLGPHLLTQLLLPALIEAGRRGSARIVNVASTQAGGLDAADPEFQRRKYNGLTAYSQGKQANRMLTWELAEKLKGSGVTANAMSPGLVKTELNRSAKGLMGLAFGAMVGVMGMPPAKGADTAVWLASSPAVEGVTGEFFVKRKERPCKFRQDKPAIERLSTMCDRMTGIKEAMPV
jgi:NAD(P)-dependent dehydrogenase (short-subunit alcohol dehydrogenase family)